MARNIAHIEVVPAGGGKWTTQIQGGSSVIAASKSEDPEASIEFHNASTDKGAPDLVVRVKGATSFNAFKDPNAVRNAQPFRLALGKSTQPFPIRDVLGIGKGTPETYPVHFRHEAASDQSESSGPGDTEVQIDC